MDLVKWDKFEKQIDITRDLKELSKLHVELNAIQILAKYSKQQEGAQKVHNKAGKYKTKIEIQAGEIYAGIDTETYHGGVKQVYATKTSKQQAEKETGKSRQTLNLWSKESEIAKGKEKLLDKYEVKCNSDEEKTEWTSKGFINYVINSEPKENTDRLELPKDKYRIIYADPPWRYPTAPSRKKVEKHFNTLPDEEIAENAETQDLNDGIDKYWANKGWNPQREK